MKNSDKKKQHYLLYITKAKSNIQRFIILYAILFSVINVAQAQTPTLGTYADTSFMAGQMLIIAPTVAPTNALIAGASCDGYGTESITVNPTTGVIALSNFTQSGTYKIDVKALNGNSTATTTFTVVVNKPNPSTGFFTSGTSIAIGQWSHNLFVNDFNNDGLQDIAVMNEVEIHIVWGNGNGGFTSGPITNLGGYGICISDFNGDGNLDIIARAQVSNSISVWIGNGSGNFSLSKTIYVGSNISSVKAMDFNNDGIKDFALANDYQKRVSIWMGDGTGDFNVSQTIQKQNGSFLNIAVGNFIGTNDADLAIGTNTKKALIYEGQGNGIFVLVDSTNLGSYPSASIVFGQFDSSRICLASLDQSNYKLSIRGNDAGHYTKLKPDFKIGNILNGYSGELLVGDFNGDGLSDFTFSTAGLNSVGICFGDGLGGISNKQFIPVKNPIQAMAIADFNNDGFQDIAYSSYYGTQLSVIFGGGIDTCLNTICNNTATLYTVANELDCTDGKIKISLNGFKYFPYIEVFNDSNQLVRSIYAPLGSSHIFRHMEPGKYTVKIFDNTCCEIDLVAYVKCAPPSSGFLTNNITTSSVGLNWDKVNCASGYRVDYRQLGSAAWNSKGVKTNIGNKTIYNLLPSTTYEWRVSTKCTGTELFQYIDHSETQLFTTAALRVGGGSTVSDMNINLYPNPATNIITVNFENDIASVLLKVVNTIGQTIMEKQLFSEDGIYQTELDISKLKSSIYFLQLETNNGIVRTKFIKE